jgi:prepilin-type N-terminal cleavage/methylation domain-containing protein/prepilin-type processing-associated H-X9-DG protein
MKASVLNSPKLFARRKAAPPVVNCGFTLIELLVVIAIIAILAALLLPVLAKAKSRALRMQCMSQMKQLDLGINLFTGDHDERYPPAGFQATTSAPGGGGDQLSWDSYIYSYIGGGNRANQDAMTEGVYTDDLSDNPGDYAAGLKILACPADTFPKVNWMYNAENQLQYAVRTYAMNSAGVAYGTDIQVNPDVPRIGSYPLPDLSQPNRHGVGIFWSGSGTPDWNAPGYPTSVVRDPAGTILLCELASSMQCEGNIWPCTCCGPQTSDGAAQGWGNLYQTDTVAATYDAAKLSSGGYNEGQQLYAAHNNRFNYAFHDGHVETLTMLQTIGTVSGPAVFAMLKPRGMWTVVPGD